MDKTELAERLCEAALLRGTFTLRSGKTSNYYFDKYLFETRPDLLRPVAELFAQMVPPQTDRLAGPALGAVPLVTALALETGLPFVIVRKEAKGYGTGKRLEGRFEPGDNVVMVEDVVTTGGAALSAVEALRAGGAASVTALAVLDRQEGGPEAFARADVPFQALFTSQSLGIKA
jgi:orotate phosphoribosyltransferase